MVNHVRKQPDASTADVAASFQEAVVDVLVTKARRAAADVGARALCLAGGVAANSLLRSRTRRPAPRTASAPSCPAGPCAPTTPPWSPPPGTGASARGDRSGLDLGADPNLRLVLDP